MHGLIVLSLLVWLLGGVPPWRFLSGMSQAMLTAFSTRSSTATLPVTMRVVESNLQVPSHLPLEGIGLILAVDRILDMFRTMVNVEGAAGGAVILTSIVERKSD